MGLDLLNTVLTVWEEHGAREQLWVIMYYVLKAYAATLTNLLNQMLKKGEHHAQRTKKIHRLTFEVSRDSQIRRRSKVAQDQSLRSSGWSRLLQLEFKPQPKASTSCIEFPEMARTPPNPTLAAQCGGWPEKMT